MDEHTVSEQSYKRGYEQGKQDAMKWIPVEDEQKPKPKHPSYNCQRGMLCPTCDKALWVRIEIKGVFGTKKITVKEQPNFCKYCGQALLPAYSEV